MELDVSVLPLLDTFCLAVVALEVAGCPHGQVHRLFGQAGYVDPCHAADEDTLSC